jgi:hypothetical protein
LDCLTWRSAAALDSAGVAPVAASRACKFCQARYFLPGKSGAKRGYHYSCRSEIRREQGPSGP